MRRTGLILVAGALMLGGCQTTFIDADPTQPAAPVALAVSYFAGSVQVTWELGPGWDGEAFRVYSRRVTDSDFFFIAEVTSCIDDFCLYEDLNVVAGETYEYIVSAVNDAGNETDAASSVEIFVPFFDPPPVPDSPWVIALDGANYVTWGPAARTASDFSHYKVYLDDGSDAFLLGETDSDGFLDELAQNGLTYSYFVTSVDADGHESDGSLLAFATPRPDFTGEVIYDDATDPDNSGFIFSEDEDVLPIVSGGDPLRHFRFETDANGWWLVPGPDAVIYPNGFPTSALKCGPGSDGGCVDIDTAPLTGYTSADVSVVTQESYVMRVLGSDGELHYGVIRVSHLGADQTGDLMIFDWAYQLQPGNPDLSPPRGN